MADIQMPNIPSLAEAASEYASAANDSAVAKEYRDAKRSWYDTAQEQFEAKESIRIRALVALKRAMEREGHG